jgi:hypothetical protein
MDYEGINGTITVFGTIGLGLWTVISSYQRASDDESGKQLNQFLTLLLFRGLIFGITYAVATTLADSRDLFYLSIPALIAGGLYINHLGKSRY